MKIEIDIENEIVEQSIKNVKHGQFVISLQLTFSKQLLTKTHENTIAVFVRLSRTAKTSFVEQHSNLSESYFIRGWPNLPVTQLVGGGGVVSQ